jgi:LacI family transcriptional regulator
VINSTRFVSGDTRKRVLQAIDELGYVPSSVARSLTTKKTRKIGVLIPDVSNHHFSAILRGIEDALGQEDYGLIVCNTDEVVERETHYLDLLLQQRVDGIATAAVTKELLLLTRDQGTPLVFVDRSFDGLEGPFVGVCDRKATCRGVSHFIETGHQRIGIVAGPQHLLPFRERLGGFRQTLQEYGLSPAEEWIATCDLSANAGQEATRGMLASPERPTALFLSGHRHSLGALLAIRDLGLRCPQDISLIGFGDHPWTAVSDPPLSVIRSPGRTLGRVAGEMLSGLIRGELPGETRVILDCELVLRRSCCPSH